MYEDQPQELVHDLISEATFGSHPLGRPVIGRAEVISSVTRRTVSAYHRSMYVPGNVVVAAAGNVKHEEFERLLVRAQRRRERRRAARAEGAAGARQAAAAEPALPAQGHRAVPRLHRARPGSPAPTGGASQPRCSTGSSAARPPRGSSRRSARSAGWPTPSTASPRSTPTPARSASTSARARTTSRPCLEIASEQIADIAGGNVRPERAARAKENLKGRIMLSMESTSNRMSRLGKSLITDTELLSIERIMAEIDAVEPDALAELAEVLLAPEKLSAAGHRAATRAASSSAVEHVNPGLAPRRVKVVLFGRGGQGRLGGRARRSSEPGTSSVELRRAEAMVDFTAPEAVAANVRAALEQGVPCVVGTSGWDPAPLGAAGGGARPARASWRRTSRSGRSLMMRWRPRRRATCRGRDRRAAWRGQEGRAVGDGARRPRRRSAATRCTRSGSRASSRTRRCCSAATASC